MARTHNFSAGPAALPTEVSTQAAEEMLDFQGSGMSVMEMSHRSKIFVDIAATAEQDLRDLFAISDDYHVLFLQGGALKDAGYQSDIDLILHPAWTTDWITPRGRKALEDYGIAAPLDAEADKDVLLNCKRIVKCTNCGSQNTRLVSQFGSTACKAQFQCDDCQEPFDYFKCLK